MAKKACIIILIILVLLTFTACGLEYSHSLPEDLHNQVQLILGEANNKPEYVIYQGNKYKFVEEPSFIKIDKDEEDVLVSWNGYRYVGYVNSYYSNTLNNPLFIYYKTWLFLREDYNCTKDIFLIDGINTKIVLEDVFKSKVNSFDFVNPVEVVLSSEQCPKVKIYLKLVCVEKQWYLSFPYSQEVWVVSDEFIELLSENKII